MGKQELKGHLIVGLVVIILCILFGILLQTKESEDLITEEVSTTNKSSASSSYSSSMPSTTSTKTTYSNSEVKKWIEARYEYYDKIEGGYAGDKYTNTILQEASEKFDMSVTEVKQAWDGAIFSNINNSSSSTPSSSSNYQSKSYGSSTSDTYNGTSSKSSESDKFEAQLQKDPSTWSNEEKDRYNNFANWLEKQ